MLFHCKYIFSIFYVGNVLAKKKFKTHGIHKIILFFVICDISFIFFFYNLTIILHLLTHNFSNTLLYIYCIFEHYDTG